MSRDGYLPPGCTEKDVDMSAPGYDEDAFTPEELEQEEKRLVGEDLYRMRILAEQIAGMGNGYRAALMETIDIIIKENKLDRFSK